MTKKIIVLALCFLFFQSISAQNYFVVKGGLLLSNQSNEGGSTKLGIIAGGSYEYQFSKTFWLSGGLEYVEKGLTLGTVGNVTQYSRRIKYYEVPLLLKYKYYLNPGFHWALVAGPSIGFAGSAKNKFFRIAQPVIETIPINKNTGVNPTDIGINIGGELNFSVSYGQISLFTNYQKGLTDVMTGVFGNQLKNNLLSFGLMFKFGRPLEDPLEEDQ